MTSPAADQQSLKDEIADLERRLHDAKVRLNESDTPAIATAPASDAGMLSHRRPHA